MKEIIGREREIAILDKAWKSKEAEFVAVYGRRRVGKTYLIRKFFSKKGLYFELTGMKDASLAEQLQNFVETFGRLLYPGLPLSRPSSWRDAFKMLTDALPSDRKITLFFDELPWLAHPKSKFMQALDYFWNTHWSQMPNVTMIVCGSAASWMLEKLINAKGGLHNRLTQTIRLQPFNLNETEQFLRSQSIRYAQKQVLDLYMVMGGIPYYLKHVEKGKSAVQNINAICFQSEGLLRTEFPRLFHSLFNAAEVNLRIVREIAKRREGISREELIRKTKIESGGTLSRRLHELEAAGFIRSITPYGYYMRRQYYKVIDEYTMFYLNWIEPLGNREPEEHYWENRINTPAATTWHGYAFESVCDKHRSQIRKALGLGNIATDTSSWRSKDAQIDLLLDRADGAITICEIKYSKNIYSLDKSYAKKLANRLELFEKQAKPNKQLFLALITTQGLKKGLWSEDLIDQVVTLKDLFKSAMQS